MVILDYVLPIALLITSILSLAVFIYVASKACRVIVAFVEGVQDFFEVDAKTGVSPYGQSIANIVEAIGVSTGSGVQRAITGSLGGTMKNANAEAKAQLMEENPQAATMMAIADSLPKSIRKNDLLTGIIMRGAMQAFNGLGGGGNGAGVVKSNSDQSVFDI